MGASRDKWGCIKASLFEKKATEKKNVYSPKTLSSFFLFIQFFLSGVLTKLANSFAISLFTNKHIYTKNQKKNSKKKKKIGVPCG